MNPAQLVPRRDDTCPAPFHGRSYATRGCCCPPSEADRQRWRACSRRRATGPRTGRLVYSGDVDEIAVGRLVAGEPAVWVTVGERCMAVAVLTARGMSAAEIAARLRCNPRTVVRYRARQATP